MKALVLAALAACGGSSDQQVDAQPVDATIDASQLAATVLPSSATFDPAHLTHDFTIHAQQLAIAISGIAVSNPASFALAATTCGASLSPNASCTFTIAFTPGAGDVTATATVDAAGASPTVALIGTDLAPPALSVDPTLYDFGHVAPTNGGTHTFTFSNAGGAMPSPLAVALGGADAAQWMLGADTCSGQPLTGGAKCSVDVTYKPTSTGSKFATLTATAGTASAVATLVGSCCAPSGITIAPSTRDFGAVGIGSVSTAQHFVVTNVGGSTTALPSSALAGPAPAQFELLSTTCTAPLAAGETCGVDVAFAPTASGNWSANLTVTTGTVIAQAGLFGQGANVDPFFLSSSSLDFGSVAIGASAQKTLTMSNTGTATVGAPQLVLGGANAAEFSVASTTCTSDLAPNTSCTIVLAAMPSATGTRHGSLLVSAVPGGNASVALTVVGL